MKKIVCLLVTLCLTVAAGAKDDASGSHIFVGADAGYPGFAAASFGVYTPTIGYWYLRGAYFKDVIPSDKVSFGDECRVETGYMFRILASSQRRVNFYLGGGVYGGMKLNRESFEDTCDSPRSSVFDLDEGRFWGFEPKASLEFFVASRCALSLGCAYARSRVEGSLGILFVF